MKINYGILLDGEFYSRKLGDMAGIFLTMMLLCIFSENRVVKLPVSENAADVLIISESMAQELGIIPKVDAGDSMQEGLGSLAANRLGRISAPPEGAELSVPRSLAADEFAVSGEGSPEDVLLQPSDEGNSSDRLLQPQAPAKEPPVSSAAVPSVPAVEITEPVIVPEASEPAIVPEESEPEPVPDSQTEASEMPEESSENTKEEEQLLVCNGFLMDTSGKIIGCRDVALTDGVLCLPFDAGCTGVAAGALDSLGSEVYEIYVPANIVLIEDGAFDSLTELIFVQVHPDNPVYESKEGVLGKK